ncbi:MAG: MarR family transcriptional regulator [Verrucomicrobiota bacterium]
MAKIYRNSGPHLFLLFWKASHSILEFDRRSIQRAGCDSLTDFAVLEVLLHKGSLPVNEIGEKVLLTSGSITTAVQRLEKKGLVTRIRADFDKRVVKVDLTANGRELIEESFEKHSSHLDELFSVLTGEEKEVFASLVRKVGIEAEKRR